MFERQQAGGLAGSVGLFLLGMGLVTDGLKRATDPARYGHTSAQQSLKLVANFPANREC